MSEFGEIVGGGLSTMPGANTVTYTSSTSATATGYGAGNSVQGGDLMGGGADRNPMGYAYGGDGGIGGGSGGGAGWATDGGYAGNGGNGLVIIQYLPW